MRVKLGRGTHQFWGRTRGVSGHEVGGRICKAALAGVFRLRREGEDGEQCRIHKRMPRKGGRKCRISTERKRVLWAEADLASTEAGGQKKSCVAILRVA